ncbi:hypothetical protein MB02_08785 [Croceicoccus estronivorus]|nr:hypothetical protein MB02_08785 [Croceicoccus estronivorus]
MPLRDVAWRAAWVWLPVSLFFLAFSWQGLTAAPMWMSDADDALRLVQVRDLLAGQGWFDLHQYRSNAPDGGVLMHWSRLVDIPLAAVILLLKPLLGQAGAEMVAVATVPLGTFYLALLLTGRLAGRLAGRDAVLGACLVAGLSLVVVAQMRPLRIDHHGWQVVCALAALNALFARRPRPAGWLAGLALAAELAISMEGLPLAVAVAAVAAWRWLRDPAERAWAVTMMQGLAGGSVLLFLATRGFADLATHCDAIAPVHLAIFVWGAFALTVLAALPRQSMPVVLGGFAVTGGIALAILAWAAPICLGGGFAELPPSLHENWLVTVPEGRPVWEKRWPLALQIALPLALALVVSLRRMMAMNVAERSRWGEFTALLAVAVALALIVSRASATAQVLSAIPLGWLVGRWLATLRAGAPLRQGLAILAGLLVVLFPMLPATLAASVLPASGDAESRMQASLQACGMEEGLQALSRLPRGEILSLIDMGSHLLMGTPHGVVATGHHRAVAGMLFEQAAFKATPDQAQAMLAARGTSYVALCVNMDETRRLSEEAPGGLAAGLVRGEAPSWLTPVPVNGAGAGFRLWRVR